MEQSLTVQEPYPLHHVESNLHPRSKVQPHLESSVKVTRVAGHDEENHGIGAIRVVIINASTYQVHYSVVLRHAESWGGGGGGGGRGGLGDEGEFQNSEHAHDYRHITFYDLVVHPVNAEV